MRLITVVALTLWLAGASARVGDDPYNKYRKEHGKGITLGSDYTPDDEELDDDDEDDGKADDEDDEKADDDAEDSEKTKETSVHRKHFMDQYYLQSGPVQYEFGHVYEDPEDWEHRYEKRDFDNNRHQGQVKWGDAGGGLGEHYWDFNHGGSIDDDDDRMSDSWYSSPSSDSSYRGPSESYGGDRGGGKKAMGVIKEKLTITKKKNGKTVDETKINMEKQADIDQIVKKHEPRPFADDKELIEEFKRKTKSMTKKGYGDSFDEDDSDSKDFFSNSGGLRRMDSMPLEDRTTAAVQPKKPEEDERQEIRRHDSLPKAESKQVQVVREPPQTGKDKKPATDLVAKATINIDTTGGSHFDPVTGSLTDSKTGRKFKIFGVLIDS